MCVGWKIVGTAGFIGSWSLLRNSKNARASSYNGEGIYGSINGYAEIAFRGAVRCMEFVLARQPR